MDSRSLVLLLLSVCQLIGAALGASVTSLCLLSSKATIATIAIKHLSMINHSLNHLLKFTTKRQMRG